MNSPGELIASGRAADVFDIGGGRVLRRYKADNSCEAEARLMVWLSEQGVRVPVVESANGRDLVMERIYGPTMLDDLAARPWKLVAHMRLLASLQRQVNSLVAPYHLGTAGTVVEGDRVLHLDLHPMNVLISASGPVIIDWTNARRGSPAFDAALSFVLMLTFEAQNTRDRIAQGLATQTFRLARGRSLVASAVAQATAHRLADANVTAGERVRLEKLLRRTRKTE